MEQLRTDLRPSPQPRALPPPSKAASSDGSPGTRLRGAAHALALFATLATLATLAGCADEDPAGLLQRDFAARGAPEAVVCAGPTTLQGIDVSSWQGDINWSQVAASGRAFAIARIGDGYYLDGDFAYNWQQIKQVGMVRGAYQFFRAGQDPIAQANIVIDAVGWLGEGDLPVTLDLEDQGIEGVPTSTVVANMNTWLAAVEAGTGKRPIIYTGYYIFDDYQAYGDYSSYPLWIAAWYTSCCLLYTSDAADE